MNKHRFLALLAVVLAALLLLSLTGCAKTGTEAPADADTQNAWPDSAPLEKSAGEPAEEVPSETAEEPAEEVPAEAAEEPTAEPPQAGPAGVEPAEDGAYYVGSVRELMEAVRPYARIVLAPGRYSISEYLETLSFTEVEQWNYSHGYVRIRECFDGWELVIQNADYISIEGGTDDAADTELVTDPRYAALLNFDNCYAPCLLGLTMGHTETGTCLGNVLTFTRCSEIQLENLDLYGCGVYGIGAYDGCSGLYAADCVIRDCEYGPFDIYGCSGEFIFTDCKLTGSSGGGSFDAGSYYDFIDEYDASLAFRRCTFGDTESGAWYYRDDIYTEDCVWSEDMTYPEY